MKFAIAVVIACCLAMTLSATPTGVLTVGQCAGTGVSVSATLIDWLGTGTPPRPNDGCLVTSIPTLVTYTGGGPLGTNTVGSILDLPVTPGAIIVPDFMLFSGNPNLHFNLTSLGPGVNTDCSTITTFVQGQPDCSIIVGGVVTPFILTANGSGTTVSLSLHGTVTDTTGTSDWSGPFTTQFANVAPSQIESAILSGTTVPAGGGVNYCQGGVCTNSYGGTLTISIVPEPGSLVMIGGGLMGLALIARKFRRV
jgi:hypothetical protein